MHHPTSELGPTAFYLVSHHTVFFSSLLPTIVLCCWLYSSMGGGDGDNICHSIVTRILLLSSKLSIAIHLLLAVAIWYWFPDARHMVVLPLGLFAWDLYQAKTIRGVVLPSFWGPVYHHQRSGDGTTNNGARTPRGGGGDVGTGAPSFHDCKSFFQALACKTLDILSRSLWRKSFKQVALALMVGQFLCMMLWW